MKTLARFDASVALYEESEYPSILSIKLLEPCHILRHCENMRKYYKLRPEWDLNRTNLMFERLKTVCALEWAVSVIGLLLLYQQCYFMKQINIFLTQDLRPSFPVYSSRNEQNAHTKNKVSGNVGKRAWASYITICSPFSLRYNVQALIGI